MTKVRALIGALLMVALASTSCAEQGNVFSLEVGDCFDGAIGNAVSNVPIVDCSGPHGNEVYAVWDITSSSLPSADEIEDSCGERFVARTFATDDADGLFFSSLRPSEDSFADGDREVVCIVVTQPPRAGSLFEPEG